MEITRNYEEFAGVDVYARRIDSAYGNRFLEQFNLLDGTTPPGGKPCVFVGLHVASSQVTLGDDMSVTAGNWLSADDVEMMGLLMIESARRARGEIPKERDKD